MKRFIIMALCLTAAVLYGRAENYPYRADYLWVTVPDRHDWIYRTGENASADDELRRMEHAEMPQREPHHTRERALDIGRYRVRTDALDKGKAAIGIPAGCRKKSGAGLIASPPLPLSILKVIRI